MTRDEVLDLVGRDVRLRLGEQARRAGERGRRCGTASRTRRAARAAASATTTALRPRASRRSGTPRRRAARREATSDAGGFRLSAAGARRFDPTDAVWVPRILETVLRACHFRRPADPPARIQIQRVTPQVDCGRYAVKRTVGERVDVTARIFRDGHELLGAAVRYKPAGATRWLEAPLAAARQRRVGGLVRGRPGRHVVLPRRGVGRPGRLVPARAAAEGRRRARRISPASSPRAPCCFGVETLTVEAALAAPAGDRSEKTWSPTYEVDVDRELARFGSWYELFPRSWGGFEGVRAVLPQLAELGFDVVYLPPVHPIGRSNRKGRNNALEAGPADPGSPWAIGSRGGRSRRDQSGARHGRAVREARRGREEARDRDRARLRDPVLARPSVAEGAPGVVQPPARRHAEVRREPAEAYQDIYNVNFDSEDWKGLWEALRDVVLDVGEPRRHGLPRRQSAHEARGVLGVADRRGAPRASRGDLPRRGVHAPRDDDDARQGRLRAELHVLHVEEHALGAARVHRRSCSTGRRPTGRTSSRTRRTSSRVPRRRRPRRPSRRGSCSPATLSPSYGIYSGFEHFENVPARARLRGVPRLGEVRGEEALARRAAAAARRSTLNLARRENAALQHLDNVTFLETENEQLFAYLKRTGDNAVVVVVNLDRAVGAGRGLHPARPRPACPPPIASTTCSRATTPTGHGTSAATTFASHPARATS